MRLAALMTVAVGALALAPTSPGRTVIEMPPPPGAVRAGDVVAKPAEAGVPISLGEVALARYAGARRGPSYVYMSRGGRGWPYHAGTYGWGWGFGSGFGYGWSWPHHVFPSHYGYGWGWPHIGRRWGRRAVFIGW